MYSYKKGVACINTTSLIYIKWIPIYICQQVHNGQAFLEVEQNIRGAEYSLATGLSAIMV